jgi:hypothetical protein
MTRNIPETISSLMSPKPDIPRGTVIHPRDGDCSNREVGTTTGTLTRCQLEGCGSWRVWTTWKSGGMTKPCLKGMRANEDGSYTIV